MAMNTPILHDILSPSRRRLLAGIFRTRTLTGAAVQLEAETASLAQNGNEAATYRFLHPAEQMRLLTFHHAKRRTEWLGGRLAAKAAAAWWSGRAAPPAMTEDAWQDWRVENNPSGKPEIHFSGNGAFPALPQISISHSGGWAAAIAADAPCGLDIQAQTPSVQRVAERFATDEERQRLTVLPAFAALDETARLTLLWAAKEALRKVSGDAPLPGFLQLILTDSLPFLESGGVVLNFRDREDNTFSRVYVWDWNGYGAALTVGD